MKLKIVTLTTVVSFLFFIGCGGGGGDASFSNGQTMIDINVTCIDANVTALGTYIPLQSGDAIVKDDGNTTVKIYHDVNGTKLVCLVSGKAHILR